MHLLIYGCILGILLGGVYALMASGLALVWGIMRVLNIAQAICVILGSYLAFTASSVLHVDPLLAIIPVAVLMFLLGVAIYYAFLRPIRRERESLSILVTYAVAIGIEGTLGLVYSTSLRHTETSYVTQSFDVGGFQIPAVELYAFLISIAILGLLALLLQRTRLGRALRAATQNPTAARLLGVDIDRVAALGFGIGISTAAAAGAVYGMLYSFNPNSHYDLIGILLAIVVLGGFGSMRGAIVAALILGVASSEVFVYWPLWANLSFYGILALVLLFRPQGLWGLPNWATQ